ncbi:MAG: recombinase family protein [Clostridia bacterium]|nr:recombinase family protein [Clostridia bacterium]
MRKAVFYGRYSSANQTEQSIEGQLHVCEKYAAENDILIVDKYIDRALSGTTDKRPQFQQMIADSSAGTFDTVLVYKLDRFARNRYDSAIHKKKLRDNGVRVVSATEPLSDTPEGIILEGLLEGIDEYFSKELSRKCKRGLKESCDKGYFICNTVPLGYKKIDRRLEIDPETLPIIQRIFTEYAGGKSPERIANELNAAGLTVSGRAFHKKTVRDWLKNEVFIGRFHCGENIVEVPAAISPDLWERVQERRANVSHLYRHRNEFKYFLTGRAFCAECGGRVCGRTTNGFNYYYCTACRKHIIQAEPLHDKVKRALYEYLTEDKIKELAAAAYREYQSSKPEDPTVPLRAELKRVEKQIGNILQAIMDGSNSAALRDKLSELESRKAAIADEMTACEKHSPDLKPEHFEYVLSRVLDYPEEQFEKLLGILVDRVIVSKEQVIVCINLTDTNEDPPLEKIRIEGECLSLSSSYAYISAGWLMIAA